MLARTTTGGHLGLFMGTEALREHWPVVMAAALEHSLEPVDADPRAPGRAAPRRSRSGRSRRLGGALTTRTSPTTAASAPRAPAADAVNAA